MSAADLVSGEADKYRTGDTILSIFGDAISLSKSIAWCSPRVKPPRLLTAFDTREDSDGRAPGAVGARGTLNPPTNGRLRVHEVGEVLDPGTFLFEAAEESLDQPFLLLCVRQEVADSSLELSC